MNIIVLVVATDAFAKDGGVMVMIDGLNRIWYGMGCSETKGMNRFKCASKGNRELG